jgi:hypothetical protein
MREVREEVNSERRFGSAREEVRHAKLRGGSQDGEAMALARIFISVAPAVESQM